MGRTDGSKLRALGDAAGGSNKASALRFYGDRFVFDTESGRFYRVTPTASFMLRALQRGVGPDRLADLLESEYHIDRATAARDASRFVKDMQRIEPFNELAA